MPTTPRRTSSEAAYESGNRARGEPTGGRHEPNGGEREGTAMSAPDRGPTGSDHWQSEPKERRRGRSATFPSGINGRVASVDATAMTGNAARRERHARVRPSKASTSARISVGMFPRGALTWAAVLVR